MFRMAAQLAITSISPLTGPVGTQVTITGQAFTPGVQVTFANLVCQIVSRQGDSSLLVLVPAGVDGRQDFFRVQNEQGQLAQSAQAFQVTAPPVQNGVLDPKAAGTPCENVRHYQGEKEPILLNGWDCSMGAGTAHHEHAHDHPHPIGDHHHHPHAHPHRSGPNGHHHPY